MHKLETVTLRKLGSKGQEGFSYIEVMCAVVILMVGILAQLSAISFSMLRQQEAEQQSQAKQIISSTFESIFAARDLGNENGINNFAALNTTDNSSSGIFIPNWNPIRTDSGIDGILGTADDTCGNNATCTVGNYTNSSPLINGFERKIVMTDIKEAGETVIKKRRVEVAVRFFVGQLRREQTSATIIADLPFYK